MISFIINKKIYLIKKIIKLHNSITLLEEIFFPNRHDILSKIFLYLYFFWCLNVQTLYVILYVQKYFFLLIVYKIYEEN